MEDIEGLKNVLERVETKLLIVKNIHAATAFVYWETALAVLYFILTVGNMNTTEYVIYWGFVLALYYPLWKRSKRVFSAPSNRVYMIRALVIATIVCIPLYTFISKSFNPEYVGGIFVLCAVSVYLTTIAAMIKRRTGRFPKEMLPAIMSFAFIPLILKSENPVYMAGYVVIVTYSITALLYLSGAIGVFLES